MVLPCTIGVSYTFHVLPLSSLTKQRAFFPPETMIILLFRNIKLVLLAAKAASPSSTLGNFSQGIFCQELPPSVVVIIFKQSAIGSPIATPKRSSKNCMLS